MGKLYEIGEVDDHIKRKKYKYIFLVAGFIVGVGAIYIFLDVHGSFSTDDSKNSPISGTIESDDETLKSVDKPTFTMKVPADWEEKVDTPGHYQWQSSLKESTARFLDIYVGSMPGDHAVNKMLPINLAPNGKLSYGTLSAHCRNFTETKQVSATPEPEPSLWENIDFTCNFIEAWNKVGTGNAKDDTLVTIKGQDTSEKYFFVYTDHNGRPDINFFYDVLLSFQAK